jgi:protein SCO1/2
MARLQRDLGQDLGEKVVLLSLSVTPGRDTPAQLARIAVAFKPRPGWFWLTGEPARMQPVLQAFGAAVAAPERHAPMILVGRGGDPRWLRRLGLPSPAELRSMIARFAR